MPSPPLSSPSPSFNQPTPMSRGGIAIGVPAHQPRPPQPIPSFVPSFGQPFSHLVRNPDQTPVSSGPVRSIQGVHSIGMIGSLSTGPHIRPNGISGNHQRVNQPPLRTTSSSANQSLSSQKFHGHAFVRTPPISSPISPSPVPQSSQPQLQPLTSAGGKQMHAAPLPCSSYRPQMKSQALQQRPQHIQSPMTTSLQQQTPPSQQQQQQKHQHQQQKHQQQLLQQSQQQQVSLSPQSQEHHNQQHLPVPLRNQQSMPQHQQAARTHGSTAQKSNVLPLVQSSAVPMGPITPSDITDPAESGNQILSKRSIRELVTQIDPSEKLDLEVEDVLAEIADDFVESVTTFACSLAKHRKSNMLEAKDILLHVERNWNMTLPGFTGDEIKCYKKQLTNDIHKERLAVIKKSMILTNDTGSTKNPPAGQVAMNLKAHTAKTPAAGPQ